MTRALLLAAAIALTPLAGGPAEAGRHDSQQPRPAARDRDLQALVWDAMGLAPEFSADTLIRLATSGAIRDRGWRREMLEDAFMRAYVAQEPYRRITGEMPHDTRQGAVVRAGETGLTRVSLQVQAAVAMAGVDAARGRELFEWIDLNLVAGVCTESFAPAVDEYYSALVALAATFPKDPGGRGDALQFLELFLWRAHLPTEMPAVARAIMRFKPSRDEAAHLDVVFRMILEDGLRDPRGFSIISTDFVSRMMDMEDAHRGMGIYGWHDVRALRAFMVRQLTGPRCGDSVSDAPAVDSFNSALKFRDVVADGVPMLTAAETRPARVLGQARIDPYWQTIDARRLYDQALRLRGTGRDPMPLKDRVQREWLDKADRLVFDLEQWTGTREASERDAFYQKSILYTLLIDLVPPSDVRGKVLRSFAEMLRRADADRVGRALWYAFADRLFELRRSVDRGTVVALLEQSPSALLSVYGKIFRLEDRPRQSESGPAFEQDGP